MLYGQALHRCSYDNSTISSVNKLKKNNGASLLFSFLHFSFTFLSSLFCFRSLCQTVVLVNLLDIKVNPNCLFITERERDRERERKWVAVVQSWGGGRVVRWCWVNFQCRGFLLIWIIVGQGPIALAVGAGGGCLDIFKLVYLFSFLSPSFGDGPI